MPHDPNQGRVSVTGVATATIGNVTAVEVAAEDYFRTFIEIQNQSDVPMRIHLGGTATTSLGYRLLPGQTYWTQKHAASSFSVMAESGTLKTVYVDEG